MTQPKTPKLLVLCDSPTLQTGFARVAANLLPHWTETFGQIDVWGIGYQGWPHALPCRIFPATSAEDREWQSDGNLQRFLQLLAGGGYTHVWMMQDLFHVTRMANALREICSERGIRSLLYFPVDAPVSEFWVRAVRDVDVAVAYTEYGYGEVRKHRACGNLKKIILPHGTDRSIYRRMPNRIEQRKMFTAPDGSELIGPEDFLIVAVSAHQKRKGLAQTLQTFRELKRMLGNTHRRLWLYLHMPPSNAGEGSDLKLLSVEMGLKEDVLFAAGAFAGNAARFGEAEVAKVYNAADLLLTTTHGEGWGLPITEAMACGTPVAGPRHTAVAELLGAGGNPDEERGVLFDCCAEIVLPADNMRLRPVTDIHDAALSIANAMDAPASDPRSLESMAARASAWLADPCFDWQNIARRWLDLMDV